MMATLFFLALFLLGLLLALRPLLGPKEPFPSPQGGRSSLGS